MVHLQPVTPENWRCGLRVREDQCEYVAGSDAILARAYAYRNSRSEALLICNEEMPVGMALYYDLEELHTYNFSQFFIDHRYQQRGYGAEAVRLILQRMKVDGVFRKVVLCYVNGDDPAKRLYEKFGFRLTGEAEEDELVMELTL